ncbi:unnamed protein product [Rhizoctonia solani]|uniref:Uncharacterized protein n=1 Tax=Rhizoctonia solani TaxID=456999 RepID=A0A8H3E970_9AGAM|nr:unnamed protein product [Rhizoctonia solani]
MTRRYVLQKSADDSTDWLEEIELWSQRTKKRLDWDIMRNETGYTARLTIDGSNVPVVGAGNTPRSAKINVVQQVDRAEPAILTI